MASADANQDATSIDKAARRIRSHRKSRAGCYTCKGRRVKCCETRPICQNCKKASLQCVYPESQPKAVSIGLGRVQYQSRGFELKDMRFFHDYMTNSWPHLPLNSTEIWLHEMPLLAQEHEFLMNALLALGAAHIHANTGRGIEHVVNRHRRLALKGILEVEEIRQSTDLSPVAVTGKLQAALGACFALAYAATYMRDALPLWLILNRSCASFTVQLYLMGQRSDFLLMNDDGIFEAPHLSVMRERLIDAPPLLPSHVAAARAALANVRASPACTFSTPLERRSLDLLQVILDRADHPLESYGTFVKLWTLFVEMTPTELAYFTDPTHTDCLVLQAYFLAIEGIQRPWAEYEFSNGRSAMAVRVPLASLPAVPADAPNADELNALLEWPRSVVRGIERHGRQYFDVLSPVDEPRIEELESSTSVGSELSVATPTSSSLSSSSALQKMPS